MKILYICTHNRCRSILSEAITNAKGEHYLIAKSAGSQPSGQVHPLSLKYLEREGYSIDGLQSQSWDDFKDFKPDVVVTVCDSAAGESCPLYLHDSLRVHWGLSDPSKKQGSEQEIEQAFLSCIEEIALRVEKLNDIAIKHFANKDMPPSKAVLAKALNKAGAK